MLSCFSHVQLFAPLGTVAHQVLLSMGFSRQEYWSGWQFPSPGDFSDPEIELRSLMSFLHWQADSLPTAPIYSTKNCGNTGGSVRGGRLRNENTKEDNLRWHFYMPAVIKIMVDKGSLPSLSVSPIRGHIQPS